MQNIQTIEEKIQQRRLQMLVHSYIYYELNTNIVSDAKWNQWAQELKELQQKYPEESKRVRYYELFKDWDGSTGFHLVSLANDGIINKAYQLLGKNFRKGG